MNKTEVLCNGNDLAATVSAAGYLVDILAVIHLDGKDLLNITGKLGKSLFRNGPYIAKFTEGFPFYVDAVIPGGTYNSIKEDYKTFAVWVALMTTEDLPEDTAYDICKTLFEGYDSLQNVHAVASYMTPDNANAIQGVDYHPGALKYLQEQNVKIG